MTGQRWALWLVGLTLLGAALRFGFADAKGYWQDEAVTVSLLRMDLGAMLSELPDSERTPPLYYLVAWVWARVFGEGEMGLRSLSALIGAATIPVAVLAAAELLTRRIGLVVAALVAVNPILVWYSQEARAYALLVLLAAASLLFFARSLDDPRPRNLLAWGLASALAISAHYFGGFLVAAELAWLLWRLGLRRELLLAALLPAVMALALAPLALEQSERSADGDWITEDASLAARLVQAPAFLLAGFELRLPMAAAAGLAAAALAAVGLALVASRGTERERSGALVAAGLALAGIGIPLILALAGVDFLLYKNVIWVVVPALLAIAAGFGAARAGWPGPVAGVALVALSLAVTAATAAEPKYQREAWREAAAALPDGAGPRAIVMTPGPPGIEPLTVVYRPDSDVLQEPGSEDAVDAVSVSEIVVLGLPTRSPGALANTELPDTDAPPAPPRGFELAEARRGQHFLLFRYTAPRAREVSTTYLEAAALEEGVEQVVLIEP